MSNSNVLELSSLPARHPSVGHGLLESCAGPVIVRLSMDPAPQPSSTLNREVEINWIKRSGAVPETAVRSIGWSEQEERQKACDQLLITRNAEDLSELAAIGVAALLINDLEGGIIQRVLPIGSGGDYLVGVSGDYSSIQLEMSGIRLDQTGSRSTSRLQQKTEQVLKHARVGFVSVTAFSHGPHAIVHNYQHFVKKPKGKQKPRKRR